MPRRWQVPATTWKYTSSVEIPCRVRDPDRKGKVESAIGHAQKTLHGLRFESLEAAQAYLDRWEERWADTRIHGTTKRQVAAMFAEEAPHLLPLPIEPFRYYDFGDRTVHLDGCVEVQGAYYGAPPGWIGEVMPVQWDDLFVRILHPKTGELLREQLRTKPGHHRIARADLPKKKPGSTARLLARAAYAGPNIGRVAKMIYETEGVLGARRILGVLSLVKRYGAQAVDDAARAALEMGVPTYRFMRRYMERRPPAQLSLKHIDPLNRELTEYRELIQRKTEGQE